MLDRFFGEVFARSPALWERQPGALSLALDVAEQDGAFIVKASIPGVPADDVEITLTDNVRTIKGVMKEVKETNSLIVPLCTHRVFWGKRIEQPLRVAK